MVDEDWHSTDLCLGWRRSYQHFYWLVRLFGFFFRTKLFSNTGYAANCTKCLEILLLLYKLHILESDQRKVFVLFRAIFKQLSLQKATLNGFVKNVWPTFWDILGNILENLEQLVESPTLARAAWWSRLRRDNRYHSLHERFLNNQSAIGSGKGVSFYFFLI